MRSPKESEWKKVMTGTTGTNTTISRVRTGVDFRVTSRFATDRFAIIHSVTNRKRIFSDKDPKTSSKEKG